MFRSRVFEIDIGPADTTVDISAAGFGTPKFAIMMAVNNDAGSDTTYRRDMVGVWEANYSAGLSVSYGSSHNVTTSDCANGVNSGIAYCDYAGVGFAFKYTMSVITDGLRFTKVTNAFGGAKRFWIYVVWGDTVLNTKTFELNATSTQSISSFSFKPNWAFVVSGSTTAAQPTVQGGNARGLSIGSAQEYAGSWYPGVPNGAISQGVIMQYERDGYSTSATANYSYNGEVAGCIDPAGTYTWKGKIASFDANGFTWTHVSGLGARVVMLFLDLDVDDIDDDGFIFQIARNTHTASPATEKKINIGWPATSFLSFCNLSPDQSGTVATSGSYPGVMNYSMGANSRTFCFAGHSKDAVSTMDTGGKATPSAENLHLEYWDNRGVSIFDGVWDCGNDIAASPIAPGQNIGGSWRLSYITAPAYDVALNVVMFSDQRRMIVANNQVVGNIIDGSSGKVVEQVKIDGTIFHGDKI